MDCASYVFPAVRGTQAQREYYVSMVPLDVMSKIFQFADEELPPEIRAQRILNKSRIPEIRDYILSNPDSYVFSALTVSVDGNMEFTPADETRPQVGAISISMTSRFLINDGQHRRAAIAEAIKMNPFLKNEHISVVFYRDEGLLRSQQMFSDLNRYAIKPTKSINILFNSREESSIIQNELSTKLMYSRAWLKRSEPQFPTALRHYLHSARYAQRPASSLTVRIYQHKIKLIWPKNIGALLEGTLVNGIWSSPER